MGDPPSPTGGDAVVVVVGNDQADVDVDADRWAELAKAVLGAEGARGELTLTFVDLAEMTDLNREHMAGDGPTDVLSFPLDALDEPGAAESAGAPRLLGDVVVCPAVAVASAPTHAGSVDDELALLTVHGVLHVLGYDHARADEAAAMRARELELLSCHHWRGPPPPTFVHEQGSRS